MKNERLLNGTIDGVEGEHTCGRCGSAQVTLWSKKDLNTGGVVDHTYYFCRLCIREWPVEQLSMNGELIAQPGAPNILAPIGHVAAQVELNQRVERYQAEVRAWGAGIAQHVVVRL